MTTQVKEINICCHLLEHDSAGYYNQNLFTNEGENRATSGRGV